MPIKIEPEIKLEIKVENDEPFEYCELPPTIKIELKREKDELLEHNETLPKK